MTKRKLDILPLEEWALFEKRPLKVIAGPCGAETCEQVLRTASSLSQIGVNLFRAGLWKPRTYPGSFEGVGTESNAFACPIVSFLALRASWISAGNLSSLR